MKKKLLAVVSAVSAGVTALSIASCGVENGAGTSTITIPMPEVLKAANINDISIWDSPKTSGIKLGFAKADPNDVMNDNAFNSMLTEAMVDATVGTSPFAPIANSSAVHVVNPGATTPSALRIGYDILLKNEGYDMALVGGYQHIGSLKDYDVPAGKAIVLWGSNIGHKGVVGVLQKSNAHSFVGGVMAGFYLNNHPEKFQIGDDNELKAGGFAGIDIPDLMVFLGGFQQGIKWFNDNVIDHANDYSDLIKDPSTLKKVKWVDLGSRNDHFSGSFAAGDATAIADKLISSGADLILPVAGIQAADVLNSITGHNSHSEIVGIDNPMELQASYEGHVPFSLVNNKTGLTNLLLGVAKKEIKLGQSLLGGLRQVGNGSSVTQLSSLSVSTSALEKANTIVQDKNLALLLKYIIAEKSPVVASANYDPTKASAFAEVIYELTDSDISRKFNF